jgi:hypothetical protein
LKLYRHAQKGTTASQLWDITKRCGCGVYNILSP